LLLISSLISLYWHCWSGNGKDIWPEKNVLQLLPSMITSEKKAS